MADHHHTMPPQETLAVMNSHLGRFLIHADELIQECRNFGDSVQNSVEGQLEKMNGTVARALDDAAARAVKTLDGKLEQALGDRLNVLRGELDEIVRLSGDAAKRVPSPNEPRVAAAIPLPEGRARGHVRGVLVPVLLGLANIMLAAILVLLIAGPAHQSGILANDAVPTPAAGSVGDAGVADLNPADPAGAQNSAGAPLSALTALCESLSQQSDSGQAHAFVAASAAAACTSTAGAVTANVLLGLNQAGTQVIPQNRSDGKRGDKPKRKKNSSKP